MDYQRILNEIQQEVDPNFFDGEVAAYIPELAKVSPDYFGLHLCSVEGGNFHFGDSEVLFSIQSISKVLSLALAFIFEGDRLWKRVGVEPSGNPFNSLVQLEYENGKPRNPLINAGALVICDILVDKLKDPKKEYLDFIRQLYGGLDIHYNESVAHSEAATGHRNIALINLMKSFGNIHNDVNEVLDFYFYTCAVAMSCRQLAQTFLVFANQGCLLGTDTAMISRRKIKRMNAIMHSCGFYDEAGEFSFKVGLPGKSGVGGGIIAVHPERYSVAVWSPKLNKKGNSAAGIKALELLTTKTGLSIF